MHHMPLPTNHRLSSSQSIENSLLNCLSHTLKERIQMIMRQHLQLQRSIRPHWHMIARSKSQENIAAAIMPHAPHASQPNRSTPGQPFALYRKQRRVCSNDNNDRTALWWLNPRARNLCESRFASNRNAIYAQKVPATIIRLHQRPHHILSARTLDAP